MKGVVYQATEDLEPYKRDNSWIKNIYSPCSSDWVAHLPVGPSPNVDRAGAQKHNNKRFFRSFALVLGTFGVTLALTYWLPNVIFELCSITVPVWYLLNQEVYVSAIIALCLAVLTCYYR